jgi:hypothetical protein
MFRRRPTTPVPFLIAMLLIGALLPGHALAQDTGATYDMMATVGGEASPSIPDNTVSLSFLSEDQSTEYANCLLSIQTKPNGCSRDVPASTTIVAMVDESTLPDGIVPVQNPITYTTPAEGTGIGDITFEFVWADGGAPALDYGPQMMLSGDPVADITNQSVMVTVFNEDGSLTYGECWFDTVNKPGGCSVDVPANTTVLAVLDDSTLPGGIAAVETAVWYTTPAEKTEVGDIWFELVYADRDTGDEDDGDAGGPETPEDPEGPVDSLPNTGSGAQLGEAASRSGMATLSFVAAGLSMLAMIGSALARTRS